MSNLTSLVLAAVVVGVSGAASAQSETKMYRIGILTETRIEDIQRYWQDALRELGYVEGKKRDFRDPRSSGKV